MKARTPRPRRSRVARSDRRRAALRVMARMGLAAAEVRTRRADYDALRTEIMEAHVRRYRRFHPAEDRSKAVRNALRHYVTEGTPNDAAAYDDLLERRGGEQRYIVARTPEGVEVLPWRPR